MKNVMKHFIRQTNVHGRMSPMNDGVTNDEDVVRSNEDDLTSCYFYFQNIFYVKLSKL